MLESSDLTEPERRVLDTVETGQPVDLLDKDAEQNKPENGATWGPNRHLRAEKLAGILLRPRGSGQPALRAMRVQGARITGQLDLEATTIPCPLAFVGCSFEQMPNLAEATAPSIRFTGSGVPGLDARQLATRGDLDLSSGFASTDEVSLQGAHIGGYLDCSGATFDNEKGSAISADGISVGLDMFCNDGFEAIGEVRLPGAKIGGQLDCSGRFRNARGYALMADGLAVGQDMLFRTGFHSEGAVRLLGGQIGGQVDCSGGVLHKGKGSALVASGLTVHESMYFGSEFMARGRVWLSGAHIGDSLVLTGGKFDNAKGQAITADRLTVDQDMICGREFEALGMVRLVGAHIGGRLDCTGARSEILMVPP